MRKAAFATAAFAAFFVVSAHATYKPEFAANSPALRTWFQIAHTTDAARLRFGWVSCCEHADRVHTKFRPTRKTDEWSYQCTAETEEACAPNGLKIGDWKPIPPDIVHDEPIAVPEAFDENDPQVKEEFRQLRAEGVLFISHGRESCFWPPESGQ